MIASQIIFLIVAVLILASSLMVVTTRNLIHAALWLVASLFGVAVLYAILDASFMAVVQVVVYIGAIAILFIFAVMLTRREMRDRGPQLRKGWWLAALIGLHVFTALAFMLITQPGINRIVADMPQGMDTVKLLGTALVAPDAYMLPFEVASVLLLAALVGAVYVAVNKK